MLEEKALQGTTFSLSRVGRAIECDEIASVGGTGSRQITLPTESSPISVEFRRICWATKRKFGVEFNVMPEDTMVRLKAFLLECAKRNSS